MAEWKTVEGFEGRYEVNSVGEVRSLRSRVGVRAEPRILKPNAKNGRVYFGGSSFNPADLVAGAFGADEDPKGEEWRWISGYGERYQVSDRGRTRTWISRWGVRRRPKIIRGWINSLGYRMVMLRNAGEEPSTLSVHRIVLEAFVGPCPEGHECRHLNGDPADNRLENLAWGTHKENCEDTVSHGRSNRGSRAPGSKLKKEDVREIRAALREGVSQQELAKRFGVHQVTISNINVGKTWAWLQDEV